MSEWSPICRIFPERDFADFPSSINYEMLEEGSDFLIVIKIVQITRNEKKIQELNSIFIYVVKIHKKKLLNKISHVFE